MTSLLLAAAFLVQGCSPGPQLTEKSGSSGTTPAVEKQPEPNAIQQDPGSGQASTATPGQQQQDKHRFVPERVFQVDKLQKTTVKVGKHKFTLWVMDTDAKRQEGMMFLKDQDFKDDGGMIFVFLGEDERRFWMHNTLVDLDICYCDKTGKIIKTYTMTKLDETTDYSSYGGSMYVIELRAGILKKLGIETGMKFEVPEDVVSKDNGNK